MNSNKENILDFQKVLYKCWSINSSSKWTSNNPANGQCGVTSLVVNDFFGGDILKTKTSEGWHYYNRIGNKRYDFTDSQFLEKPMYLDILSNREEAFSDTNAEQYEYLRSRIKEYYSNM
ncbi:YunG family protein [Clostridium intestinale]|jgi:hypothetical protein|uniref:Uncharacterized protein n=1 Tax=Clostridium intestinale TaxID=36845 RepID=A0A7D6W313_9CLOT|nr:hypothetical protein [Clostridium intestinale]QLY81551.1 hypothetical protein HZF06_08215 [Clostridium intestinale]